MSFSTFGIQGRAGFDIVDAQFHLSHLLGPQEVIPVMDALGIESLLVDELWGRNDRDHPVPSVEFPNGFRPVSPLGQAAAIRYPDRFSYLQRLNRHDPHLPAVVEVLASTTGCRAVRASMRDETEWAAYRAGEYDRMLGLVQESGLPIFVLGRNAGELLRDTPLKFPRLQVIVDHGGWVDPEGDIPTQWGHLLRLADHPNVFLKWCHARHVFGRTADDTASLQSAFLQAIRAFGAERIMWASDTTHERTKESWSGLLEFVRANEGLSETDRQWVLGKTARAVLKWDRKP